MRDERERSLLGAEVGEAKRLVGVEHDPQRHVREIVALGHHLGSDEQPRRCRGEPLERPAAHAEAGRVGVEPKHREVGVAERVGELVLDALGPGAVAGNRHRRAGATPAGDGLAVAAVVARDEVAAAVQD